MPIYGSNFLPDNWVIEKNISRQVATRLKVIFNQAFSTDNIANSIKRSFVVNEDINENRPFLYDFDYSRANMSKPTYNLRLQHTIEVANAKLIKNKVLADYRFDIIGSWDSGQIIIMKKYNMSASDYEKQGERMIERQKKIIKQFKK
jgi:hypothetical protein